jgi:DNA-binding transcriptional LysR family regulator
MFTSSQRYEVFSAVVETGNVSTAARRLGMPRPTVSRLVVALEAHLGVALLLRNTRRVTPTEAGQRLYQRVRPLLDEWRAVEDDLRSEAQDVRGLVRVSAIPMVCGALAPVTARLLRRHPNLGVEVVANVHLVDVRSGECDAAIWAGELKDPELVSRTLSVGWVGLVASPDYLRRAGTPGTVAELARHTLLRGHSASARPRVWWPLRSGGRFRVGGAFVTNDHTLLQGAALAGQGIALMADFTCGDALRDGRLCRVLPEVGQYASLRVVVARRLLLPVRVRVLVDAVFEHFANKNLSA